MSSAKAVGSNQRSGDHQALDLISYKQMGLETAVSNILENLKDRKALPNYLGLFNLYHALFLEQNFEQACKNLYDSDVFKALTLDASEKNAVNSAVDKVQEQFPVVDLNILKVQ